MEPTSLQIADPMAITRTRTFPIGLFAVAILMFFFTFCEMSCQGNKFAEISGISLATGTQLETPSTEMGSIFSFEKPKTNTKDIPANPWAAIALLAATAGLIFYAIRHKKESQAGLIAGAAGVLALLVLKLNLQSSIAKEANGMISLSFTLPYWISLLSLAGAAALSWFRQQQPSPALGNIPTFQTPPQGKISVSRAFGQSEQPIQSVWKPMPSFQQPESIQPPTAAIPPASLREEPALAPIPTPSIATMQQAAPVKSDGNSWLIPLVVGAVGLMILATILVEFRLI